MVVLAFGLVRLTLDEWQAAARVPTKDRLVTVHASGVLPLPLAYKDRMAVIHGVKSVHHGVAFGGIYQDPKQPLYSFAEPAATLFETYPEILLPESERLAFIRDRRGCIVGLPLALRYGWKVGDVIPLTGTVYPGQWEVVVRGIYQSSNTKVFSDQELFLQWDYVNEQVRATEPDRADQVTWYAIRHEPGADGHMVAGSIDAAFANSFAETRTEMEQAFIAGWIARSGALLHALEVISGVINGIGLLVLANAMGMAVRERTREYGVMKTLGFQLRHFCVLVVGESLFLVICGSGLGLTLLIPAAQLYGMLTSDSAYETSYSINTDILWVSVGVMILVGLLAAVWPVVRLVRMTTLQGLRHSG